MTLHAQEIRAGERFEFGKNWSRFLAVLNEERISEAENSIRNMLAVKSLAGLSFLDIGSGSGLFSLAARRLGAKVHSFDYDPHSVACTRELKRRYFPDDDNWTIEEGSVLDEGYLCSLREFDVVYSWGVLHHTGDMWAALGHIDANVRAGGKLFIALYNDQGSASRRWLLVKKIYNSLPPYANSMFAFLVFLPIELRHFAASLVRGRPQEYVSRIYNYGRSGGRGMSWWYDKIDWVGGYPFEVSKPEDVFSFYKEKGYLLETLKTCGGGLGCNEYVFSKI